MLYFILYCILYFIIYPILYLGSRSSRVTIYELNKMLSITHWTVFCDTIKIMENGWMNELIWTLLSESCFLLDIFLLDTQNTDVWMYVYVYSCREIVLPWFKHAEVFITNFHQVELFHCLSLQTFLIFEEKRKKKKKKDFRSDSNVTMSIGPWFSNNFSFIAFQMKWNGISSVTLDHFRWWVRNSLSVLCRFKCCQQQTRA